MRGIYQQIRLDILQFGDNVDTINPNGLQFLTFKLSFNDYYAQDISNKIKSVKQRKIEKGEFQAGIAPYGYKKDTEIKNHLIPDENVVSIVQDIFDMFVNKGLSTVRIADILNERNIIPPSIYLKIPTFINNKEKPPEKYKWQSSQIANMLKNEVYIGNIVGRKYRKVSHKVDKVIRTNNDEHIVVENKHKAIINIDIWNRTQEKISKYRRTRTRLNEYALKEFVYCAECGNKAIYRIKTRKRKDGTLWKQEFFVCSARNSKRNDCKCKSINKIELEEKVKLAIQEELEKIDYTEQEWFEIYKNVDNNANSQIILYRRELEKLKSRQADNKKIFQEAYNDKINKVISIDDFNIFYEKLQKQKNEILVEIHNIENKLQKIEKREIFIDFKEIKNIANGLLVTKTPTREQYARLIEKIEFDSEKNLIITFTFSNMQNLKNVV